MNELQIKKLLAIIADILQLNPSSVTFDTSPENTSAWDSFAHLAILSEVEVEYGLSFDFEEMFEINSVATLLDMLNKKIG